MRAVAREQAIVGQETGQKEERRTKPADSNINPDEKELRLFLARYWKPSMSHVWKRHILKWAENVDFNF